MCLAFARNCFSVGVCMLRWWVYLTGKREQESTTTLPLSYVLPVLTHFKISWKVNQLFGRNKPSVIKTIFANSFPFQFSLWCIQRFRFENVILYKFYTKPIINHLADKSIMKYCATLPYWCQCIDIEVQKDLKKHVRCLCVWKEGRHNKWWKWANNSWRTESGS